MFPVGNNKTPAPGRRRSHPPSLLRRSTSSPLGHAKLSSTPRSLSPGSASNKPKKSHRLDSTQLSCVFLVSVRFMEDLMWRHKMDNIKELQKHFNDDLDTVITEITRICDLDFEFTKKDFRTEFFGRALFKHPIGLTWDLIRGHASQGSVPTYSPFVHFRDIFMGPTHAEVRGIIDTLIAAGLQEFTHVLDDLFDTSDALATTRTRLRRGDPASFHTMQLNAHLLATLSPDDTFLDAVLPDDRPASTTSTDGPEHDTQFGTPLKTFGTGKANETIQEENMDGTYFQEFLQAKTLSFAGQAKKLSLGQPVKGSLDLLDHGTMLGTEGNKCLPLSLSAWLDVTGARLVSELRAAATFILNNGIPGAYGDKLTGTVVDECTNICTKGNFMSVEFLSIFTVPCMDGCDVVVLTKGASGPVIYQFVQDDDLQEEVEGFDDDVVLSRRTIFLYFGKNQHYCSIVPSPETKHAADVVTFIQGLYPQGHVKVRTYPQGPVIDPQALQLQRKREAALKARRAQQAQRRSCNSIGSHTGTTTDEENDGARKPTSSEAST